MIFKKENRRKRIHLRIKKKVRGSADKPRLAIYRSNKNIYCQLIDDVSGVTLAAVSTKDVGTEGKNKVDQANEVGKLVGEKAKSANIDSVVFDRGGYLYHGRIKALAEGAREAGLQF